MSAVAETTTRSEAERVAEAELRGILIGRAVRERREQERSILAALADPQGDFHSPVTLARAASTAVALACKALGARVPADVFEDARRELVVVALGKANPPARCACGGPAQRLAPVTDDYGNAVLVPRCIRHGSGPGSRTYLRADGWGMPRTGAVTVAYLRDHALGILRRRVEAGTPVANEDLDTREDAAPWGAGLSAEDLIPHLPPHLRDSRRVRLALRATLERAASDDLGAEEGMKGDTFRQHARRGLTDLRTALEDPEGVRPLIVAATGELERAAIEERVDAQVPAAMLNRRAPAGALHLPKLCRIGVRRLHLRAAIVRRQRAGRRYLRRVLDTLRTPEYRRTRRLLWNGDYYRRTTRAVPAVGPLPATAPRTRPEPNYQHAGPRPDAGSAVVLGGATAPRHTRGVGLPILPPAALPLHRDCTGTPTDHAGRPLARPHRDGASLADWRSGLAGMARTVLPGVERPAPVAPAMPTDVQRAADVGA